MAANSSLTQDVFPLTPGRVCQPEQAPGTLASWEIWQGQLQQARTAASGRPQLDSSQMLPKCRQWWAPLGTPSFSSTSGSRPCYHTPGRLRAIGQEGTQLPQPLPPAPLTADPRSEMGSAGYQTWPLGHSQGGERGGHDPGATPWREPCWTGVAVIPQHAGQPPAAALGSVPGPSLTRHPDFSVPPWPRRPHLSAVCSPANSSLPGPTA